MLRTCSAQDLALYKLVAARLIDLHDVQSVVSGMGAHLDAARMRSRGGRFAEIIEAGAALFHSRRHFENRAGFHRSAIIPTLHVSDRRRPPRSV